MRTIEITLRTVWFVWWITWLAAAAWSDRAVKRPPRRSQILYRLLAAGGAILLFGLFRHDVGAEGILWHAPDSLSWMMVVVDTGPYGIVRHPIYSGITLASIATAVLRGTLVAWLGVIVMTLGWYVKARMEEEFLREELGSDAYGAYERRVPMLVPLPRRLRR